MMALSLAPPDVEPQDVWKVYPTHLESLRRYDQGYLDDDEMRQRLSGEYEQNEKMRIGHAIHEALESGINAPIESESELRMVGRGWGCRDLAFGKNRVKWHRDTAFLERPFKIAYDTPVGKIILSGRADVITESGTVVDYKTSTRAPNFEVSAYPSWQWRSYLVALQCEHFVYRHFQYRYDGGNIVELYEPVDLDLYLSATERPAMEVKMINTMVDVVKIAKALGVDKEIEA